MEEKLQRKQPVRQKTKNQESKHKWENNLPAVKSCRGPPASRAREEEVSFEGLRSKKELGPVRDKQKWQIRRQDKYTYLITFLKFPATPKKPRFGRGTSNKSSSTTSKEGIGRASRTEADTTVTEGAQGAGFRL